MPLIAEYVVRQVRHSPDANYIEGVDGRGLALCALLLC